MTIGQIRAKYRTDGRCLAEGDIRSHDEAEEAFGSDGLTEAEMAGLTFLQILDIAQ